MSRRWRVVIAGLALLALWEGATRHDPTSIVTMLMLFLFCVLGG